jgi:spermidine synthase
LEITGIEIDDAVLRLGRAYLGLEEQDVDTIVDDAYAWLRHARRRFDVIADDIFLSGPEDVERPARPTVQHVRDLARRLKPGGLLAANYIITGPHTETYHQARQSFQTVFSDVAVVIPPRGYNRILVGGSALAGATALGMHRDRFRRARDRALWDRLRVERVP